jgi:hypothetical protein
MRKGEREVPGSKRCSQCGTYKAGNEYNRDRRKLDGLRSQCRECQRALQREYRLADLARTRGRVASSKWRNNNHEKALVAERRLRERKVRQTSL